MPITLWFKPAMWLAAVTLAFAATYSGYTHIKQIGFDEGFNQQQKRIDTLVGDISKKIDDIETTSNRLAVDAKIRDKVLAGDISTIVARTKGKTFTIVKNGECTPSATFSDTINQLNKRANQNIKDSQK